VLNVFHYTDKDGWNAIRAGDVWRFKMSQPRDPNRPLGVYFTNIEPTKVNLRTLYKRIRVPKAKQEYVFWFLDIDGLTQLNGGHGRDRRIYFSPADYCVNKKRQRYGDITNGVMEKFG
jgi:hypothetical protein